jgi:uncharacterized protein YbjT (DUF2867 family)
LSHGKRGRFVIELKTALVAGASGIVGNAVTEMLVGLSDWRVRVVRRSEVARIAV